MAKAFKNSKEQAFYIKSKKTKKGNTTYYMTKKLDNECLDEEPVGFEVFERPDSRTLFIRRRKPNKFGLKGLNYIKKELEKNKAISDFKVDVNGDIVKIYTTDLESGADNVFGGGLRDLLFNNAQVDIFRKAFQRYEERMRIKIVERKDEKEYLVYRYCYRGSVDDWIVIDAGEDLGQLAKDNLKLIGTEAYFERYRIR
ncbi:MAG: hypothetical protein AAGJ18_21950 [Bacteroidota bacterium]